MEEALGRSCEATLAGAIGRRWEEVTLGGGVIGRRCHWEEVSLGAGAIGRRCWEVHRHWQRTLPGRGHGLATNAWWLEGVDAA